MKEKRNAKENHETETEGTNGNQAAIGARLLRRIDETNERTIRCLDEIAGNALKAAKAIVPKVADVKSHPLPAFENLVAAPVSKRTLGNVADEMADYLDEEMRYFVPGMAHGLEDFFVFWQWHFVKALTQLAAKKIAVCDTLGKTAARKKLVKGINALPSFKHGKSYAKYVSQIKDPDGGEDPTETIVRQWRAKKSAPFPPPEEFRAAMRRALKLDAEATAKANEEVRRKKVRKNKCGNGRGQATSERDTSREQVVKLGYAIYNDKVVNPIKASPGRRKYSYQGIVDYILDEPIPRTNKYYCRCVEARETVEQLANGGNDSAIRHSLTTQIKTYAAEHKPKNPKKKKSPPSTKRKWITPTIGDSSSRYKGW